MRIAVAAFGSEGDVRPYVALAKRLRAEGEEAFFVAPELFRTRAEEHGVPFVASHPGTDFKEAESHLQGVMAERNPFRQARLVFSVLAPIMADAVAAQTAAFEGADLVLHHHVDIGAYAVAKALKIPRVSGHLFHSTLKTARALPNGMSLGRPLNRLASALARRTFTKLTDDLFAPVLRAAGLAEERGIFLASGESAPMSFLAVSEALLPGDPAWGDRLIQTGYWFLEAPAFSPPPELEAFLAAGPPPVVVTFGSMTGIDGQRQVRLLIEAAGRAGCRLILQAGWAELGAGMTLPAHVHRVGYVPHDWLFARAAAVVHHGGAGTTGAVLRAGVPQIIVWHLGDQPMWGALAFRAGVSPTKAIWHRRLNARWLQRAMERIPEVRARAEELGRRVRSEDGTGRAVAAIRQQAPRWRP